MNILSIVFKHKRGGYNRRLYELYVSLADQDHQVYYVSSEYLPVEHGNIHPLVSKIPFSSRENLLFWLMFLAAAVFHVISLSIRCRIDRIINFSPLYTLLCVYPIVFYKAPAITFIRADNLLHGTNPLRNLFFYAADRVGLRLSSAIVSVNRQLQSIYQGRFNLPAARFRVLPNNLPEMGRLEAMGKTGQRRRLGLDDARFLVATSGVFSPGKNLDFLIRTLADLRNSAIKLVLIGDEEARTGERHRLEELACQVGLADRVLFCGWQEDPLPLVACADLFVFPSRFEGSPNALLEALGCGIPCFGSRTPEIAEILDHDELLFSLATRTELARMIKRAATDISYYNLIKRLSQESGRRFLFDWSAAAVELVTSDGLLSGPT